MNVKDMLGQQTVSSTDLEEGATWCFQFWSFWALRIMIVVDVVEMKAVEKDLRDYLTDHNVWDQCQYPESIVPWNLTLFSLLLIMSGVQLVLCAIQAINGLFGAICGDCKCCGCCEIDFPTSNLRYLFPHESLPFSPCFLGSIGAVVVGGGEGPILGGYGGKKQQQKVDKTSPQLLTLLTATAVAYRGNGTV
ncbi:hypothetical protein Chor_014335 [Crotalus horridus]